MLFKHIPRIFLILTVCIAPYVLHSAEIVWEKLYTQDTLKATGMFSKVKRFGDTLYIVYEGLRGNYHNIGIQSIDLNGNIINRKEILNNYFYLTPDFQISNKEIQIFSVKMDHPPIQFAYGPGVNIFHNKELEIIEESVPSKYSFPSPSVVFFDKDSILFAGEYGRMVNVLSIYDRNMNEIRYFTIDTTGFNYPRPQPPYSHAITPLKDGNILWAMPRYTPPTEKFRVMDYLIIKTDNCGNKISVIKYTLPDTNYTIIDRILETEDHCSIMAGTMVDSNALIRGFVFVKHDAQGNFKWQKVFNPNPDATGVSNIRLLKNGNIVVCGGKVKNEKKDFAIWVFDSLGNNLDQLRWSKNTNEESSVVDIIEKDNGNFLAYGYTRKHTSDFTFDEWLYLAEIKYSTSSIFDEINLNNPNYYVYPNPASDKLQIVSGASSEQLKAVKLYDMQGNIICKYFPINGKDMDIDISRLKTGLYFILGEFESGNFAISKFIKE